MENKLQARSYTSIPDNHNLAELPQGQAKAEAAVLPAWGAPGARAIPARSGPQAAWDFASRRAHFGLLAARIGADGLLLAAAFVLAYWLRYGLELGRDVSAPESFLTLSAFYPYIAIYVGITLFLLRMRGLYALPRGASWVNHMGVIAGGSFIGVSALTLGVLLFYAVLPSRLVFIYLWLCTLAVFAVERFVYRRARIWLWRRGLNIRKALVVGTGQAAQRIMKDIAERPDLGYKLLGYVSDTLDAPGGASWRVPISRRYSASLKRLGGLRDAGELIGQHGPHEVIVALPASQHAQTLAILDSCRELGVEFKLAPDLCEMRFNEVRIDALNGVPLIGVKDLALQGVNLFIKRCMDVVLVLIALAMASIPMLAIAGAIKLTSPGPVFFRQKRVGKGGRVFTCYKFRSMYRDAEARLEEIRHLNEVDGPIFKMKNDPRLTRVGKLLRQTSLDELPQLFNILKGDMSWVGPRPPTPSEVEKYSDWHLKRLDVTAGLTGLWQVSGRSNLSFDEMVKLDLYYAENWSLAFDITIMLRTVPAVLKRAGAY
jgi:exopolysaccharide biosynthesis polyprenyl glycosylphosphotransferase